MEKELYKNINWLRSRLFKQNLIFEEAFPLMASHTRFARAVGDSKLSVKKQLSEGEIEEFSYVRLDIVKSLKVKDFRHINLTCFIENYFRPELEKSGITKNISYANLRDKLLSNSLPYEYNISYKRAIKNIWDE